MVSVVPETTEAVSKNAVRRPGHGSPQVRREIFDALHLKAGKFWFCIFNLRQVKSNIKSVLENILFGQQVRCLVMEYLI